MSNDPKTIAYKTALGGVLGALAVVIMILGGALGIGTYAAPVLCCMVLEIVRRNCGKRMTWAWYMAVSILGLLLCPDKEAAAVFCFLGPYPLLKPFFDRLPLSAAWKLAYFNAVVLILYWLLMNLLGMKELQAEFTEMGAGLLIALLVLGNLTFFLLDRLLGRQFGRKK